MRTAGALLIGAVIIKAASGTSYVGDFELLGTSARAVGMGGALVALVSGPEAIYYNPALAARNHRASALFLHSEDFGGLVHHNFLGFSIPVESQGFGLGLLHNGIPGVKLTALPDSTIPPGENNRPYVEQVVNANQFVTYLSYSRALTGHVALGGNAKFIYQDLSVGSCIGMGIDLGLALTPGAGIGAGIRVRNASTSPLFWSTGTREQIAPRVTAGASKSFTLGRDDLSLAVEIELATENTSLNHSIGIEYVFRNLLSGRFGIHQGNLTFGIGARLKEFYVDYGYAGGYAPGSRELGSAQQFSGGIQF